jgi:hypothetical protein
VTTTREELNAWLGRESGKPVHIATENTDLAAELKRGLSGLSFIRKEKQSTTGRPKRAAEKRGALTGESPFTIWHTLNTVCETLGVL